MKEKPTWLVIDLKTNRPLYGMKERTMVFSTKEVAEEIASHLFDEARPCLIIQIPDINL